MDCGVFAWGMVRTWNFAKDAGAAEAVTPLTREWEAACNSYDSASKALDSGSKLGRHTAEVIRVCSEAQIAICSHLRHNGTPIEIAIGAK
jgi:hypothetical protein